MAKTTQTMQIKTGSWTPLRPVTASNPKTEWGVFVEGGAAVGDHVAVVSRDGTKRLLLVTDVFAQTPEGDMLVKIS